jgi:hypothetical protein
MSQRLRMVLAIVLLVVGCIALPVSATAWWVRGTVSDTDEFVDTMAPLAADPDIQDLVERQLVTQVMDFVDQQQILRKASEGLTELGLPDRVVELLPLLADPLRDRLEQGVTRIVQRVVESPEFEAAWADSLRELHTQLIDIITDRDSDAVVAADDSGTLNLRLATITDAIQRELVQAGVPGAQLLPTVDVSIPVAEVEQIATTRSGYDALDRWGRLLPLITLLLLAAGVAVAVNHARTGRRVALACVGVLVVTLVALAWGRQFAVDQLPSDAQAAGTAMLEILTDRLRGLLRALAVLALVIALALVYVGNDPAAVRRRARAQALYDRGIELCRRWTHTWLAAGLVAGVALMLFLFADPGPLAMLLLLAIGGAAGWIAYVTRPQPDDDALVPAGVAADEGTSVEPTVPIATGSPEPTTEIVDAPRGPDEPETPPAPDADPTAPTDDDPR